MLIYWYHLAVADANVQRASSRCSAQRGVHSVFWRVHCVERGADGLLWLAACACGTAVAFIAVLESIDVLDFVTDPCDKRDAQALLRQMETCLSRSMRSSCGLFNDTRQSCLQLVCNTSSGNGMKLCWALGLKQCHCRACHNTRQTSQRSRFKTIGSGNGTK